MSSLRPKLGDVLELPVPEGFAYLQVVTRDLGSGTFGVRGFRDIYAEPQSNLLDVVRDEHLFSVKYPVAGQAIGLRIVGNVEFSGDLFRERFVRRRGGNALGIRDRRTGTEEIVDRFLPAHYELPLDTYLTSERMLANMIRTEYRDSQAETGHSMIGPKKVHLLPKTNLSPTPGWEFFVYFPDEVSARAARRRIAAMQEVAETRATANDFGVIASGPATADLSRVESELRSIADDLGGRIDGSGVHL